VAPSHRKPLTSDSANDLSRREAVQRSSEPLKAVKRAWERRAAPNLLPPQATDTHRATSLSTDPDYSVRAGIQLVRLYADLARQRYSWIPAGSAMFW
jgi:hypothetical protein